MGFWNECLERPRNAATNDMVGFDSPRERRLVFSTLHTERERKLLSSKENKCRQSCTFTLGEKLELYKGTHFDSSFSFLSMWEKSQPVIPMRRLFSLFVPSPTGVFGGAFGFLEPANSSNGPFPFQGSVLMVHAAEWPIKRTRPKTLSTRTRSLRTLSKTIATRKR